MNTYQIEDIKYLIIMAMEIGLSYEFPPFDGKYFKYNSFPVDMVSNLPVNTNVDRVYILHSTDREIIKRDGWIWGPANKSDKTFFSSVAGHQKSLKYKCSVSNCPAIMISTQSGGCYVIFKCLYRVKGSQ